MHWALTDDALHSIYSGKLRPRNYRERGRDRQIMRKMNVEQNNLVALNI